MIKDKLFVVTGGSGLIGASVCSSIISRGGIAVSLDLNILPSASWPTLIVDCTDLINLETAIKDVVAVHGQIHGAVHAAYPRSLGWGQEFGELEYDRLSRDLSMQLGSAILFSQVMYKYFSSQGSGNFVHLGSIQGISSPKFEHYEGTNMSSPIEYTAVKAGIISITKWLAKYSFGSGVRFNCVSPGGVIDGQNERFLAKYRSSCSSNGMLIPKDVASAICFLLSEDSSMITGHNLVVDDGWSL